MDKGTKQPLLEDGSIAREGPNPDFDSRTAQAQNVYTDSGVEYPSQPQNLQGSPSFPHPSINRSNENENIIDLDQGNNYPQPEILFATVNYPALPQSQSERQQRPQVDIMDDQEVSNPETVEPESELFFLLKPHPLFKKSYFLTLSHFIICSLFIYGLFKYDKPSGEFTPLYTAFYAEFALALLHYLMRVLSHKSLENTDAPFNRYEVVPEILRIVALVSFITLQYVPIDHQYRTVLRLSDKTLQSVFITFNIIGCLSRFNFMHSLFSSSISNLVVSILFPIFIFKVKKSEERTPFDGSNFYTIGGLVFSYFMLFIGSVKVLTVLIHLLVKSFGCNLDLKEWRFGIMSNIWGFDYLFFSGFLLSTFYCMISNWTDGVWIDRFTYAGYTYMAFYPFYAICSMFLPIGMSNHDLDALRNFENEDMDDVIRDNMHQRQIGGTVRTVKAVNNGERLITLFQVSPFFFSENQVKAQTKGKKFEFTSEADSQECVICYDRNAECLIMNCMHGGVCAKCSRDILMKSPSCPFCRTRIKCVKVIEKKGENEYIVKQTMTV